MNYYRPIVFYGKDKPENAMSVAGGNSWFSEVEKISRTEASKIIKIKDIPNEILNNITRNRSNFSGLSMGKVHVMGVLNVTPDSFSDGGQHFDADVAISRGQEMLEEGASIIDIGGESTRPGADFVDRFSELNRISPVVDAMASLGTISIDTRKADVAREGLFLEANERNRLEQFKRNFKKFQKAKEETGLLTGRKPFLSSRENKASYTFFPNRAPFSQRGLAHVWNGENF